MTYSHVCLSPSLIKKETQLYLSLCISRYHEARACLELLMILVLAGLLPISSILHTQTNLSGPTWLAILLP